MFFVFFFFFKQKTAYEMRISDWSSDVCSSDLAQTGQGASVPPLPVALPSDLHMQSFGGTSQPRHQAIGGRIKRELNIEPVCLRRGIERAFYPVATRYAPSTQSPCIYLKLDMPVRNFSVLRECQSIYLDGYGGLTDELFIFYLLPHVFLYE